MIARYVLLFLLLIAIPYLVVELRYLRRAVWWKHVLWWLPCAALVAYTAVLARDGNFIPLNPTLLHAYLLLIGLTVAPMWTFLACSLSGRGLAVLLRRWRPRLAGALSRRGPKREPLGAAAPGPIRNYGNLAGVLSIPIVWFIVLYGSFVGFRKLEVNHVDYYSEELPAAFDGYRIVLFSDAHVGTYTRHSQWILQRAVDSINAQHPDMIVFTGDLQNVEPQELYPHLDILSSLKARDGVFSVLGNHDYAAYANCDEAMKVANCRETISRERQMGWTLLLNEHRIIERDTARIVIAGMENESKGGHMPQRGDVSKTLEGTTDSDFIVMLEHDPYAWRHRILPESHAQLTLSGHTHAMQFKLLGWAPIALTTPEWNGLYRQGRQSLYVTAGLGGVIPFRFGATGEIVVITLRRP